MSDQSNVSWAYVDLVSLCVTCALYTIWILLASITLYFLVRPRSERAAGSRMRHFMIAYIMAMLVTSTLSFVCDAEDVVLGLLFHFDTYADYMNNTTDVWTVIRNIALVLNFWLADTLLIYRTHVIWEGYIWLTATLIIIYLGYIGVGIVLLFTLIQPNTQFSDKSVIALATAFWSISVAMDAILTLLIAGRLMVYRYRLRILNGEHTQPYTTIAVIFAESAAIYTICGLLYLPYLSISAPLEDLFSALFMSTSWIAPTAIMLRIALGEAETKESATTILSGRSISFRCTEFSEEGTLQHAVENPSHVSSGTRFAPSLRTEVALGNAQCKENVLELLPIQPDCRVENVV